MDNEKKTVKITRLRYLRMEKGISAKELAKMAGLSDKAIYHYESFARKPMLSSTIKLCKALGVDEVNTDLTELVEVNAKWITDGRTKTF